MITPGNDDPFVIDDVLRAADKVQAPEAEVVALGPIWLASLGNTNRTPWDTDREYDEPELAKQIDGMLQPVADGRPLILNFHCPPYKSGLDDVPKLDADFRPVTKGGHVMQVSVGSVAVADAIRKYEPVAGLHTYMNAREWAASERRCASTLVVSTRLESSRACWTSLLTAATTTIC